MKYFSPLTAIFFAAQLFFLNAEASIQAEEMQLTPQTAQWTAEGTAGALRLQDGRIEADLPLTYLSETTEDGSRVLHYKAGAAAGVEVQLKIKRAEGHIKLDVTIANASKEQLWLEPRLELALPATKYEWFDGFETRKKPQQRDSIVGSLPFAAIYTQEKGWALGLNPTAWVSHFRSRVVEEDGRPLLEYASRMVVDPGASETRHFIFYCFKPDFGYLNAVDAYQKSFPDRFIRAKGVHPALAGPSNGTIIWRTQNETYPMTKQSDYFPQILEPLRWVGGGWDWCYAGFGYRPGDWLCTEELTGDWMVSEKKKPEIKFKLRDYLKKSAAGILQEHNDAYNRIARFNGAPMMYIIPSYCEWELAETHFPDSIYTTAQGKQLSSGPPWVVKFDRSINMYPHGNSYGDYTVAAIKKIVERSNIKGFAFDCIDRARQHYTGHGMERSPGRAYNKEQGVYVNSETAHAIFGERVHELKRDGVTMALTGNFRGSSGSYMAASVMDAAILEHSPWDERPLPKNVRLMMGNKSITYLHGYVNLPEIDKINSDKLVNMVSSLADFTVLQCFRYAIYPSLLSVVGSPKMIYYSKIFRDLFQNYDWQTVPAVSGHERLWLSRYGDGAGGVLFAGNSTPKEIEQPLEAVASYFNAGSVAFVDYEGIHSIENRVQNGRTSLPLHLARGDARLFAAALQWEKPFEGTVKGKRLQVLGEPILDTLTVTNSSKGSHSLFATEIPGYTLESVSINNKSIPFKKEDGKLCFEASLNNGENTILLVHRPFIGNGAPVKVSETAFLNAENNPAFTIVLAKEDPGLRHQVRRLESFFTKLDINHPLSRIPTVLKGVPLPDGPILFLGTDNDRAETPLAAIQRKFPKGEILANDRYLGVVGENADAIESTVTLLLETLHKRYPSYGYLAISGGPLAVFASSFKPGEFQNRTGLEYLPWNREK